jgi:tyrosyl-tRNA synthetase
MTTPGFLSELSWRGLLHQTTADTLPAYLSTPGRVAYAGFDPTADSLTVGNYVPMKLRSSSWAAAPG